MPDITTPHPEIVRSLLEAGGFHCGVEPRILQGRDPDWTCIIDGQTISGDIYIHQQGSSGASLTDYLIWGAIAVLAVIVLVEAWIILRQRRANRPASAS